MLLLLLVTRSSGGGGGHVQIEKRPGDLVDAAAAGRGCHRACVCALLPSSLPGALSLSLSAFSLPRVFPLS